MIEHEEIENIGVPRGALIGAGLLILSTIALAATARLTGAGQLPPETHAPLAVRDIRFEPQANGTVQVAEAPSGRVIVTLPVGEGGFVRGSLRAFAYTRHVKGLRLEDASYRLSDWGHGRLTLDDPETGNHVELNAFGPTNVEAFARLLH
jgi:putative photosynthetic complex assembly protein